MNSGRSHRNAIIRLNAILKNVGLDGVVQEVEAVGERGIEERREVAFESFDDSDEPIKKRGRKTEVTITRPLTEMEELRLLVASVRAAVIDVNETQEKALHGLETEAASTPRIAFRPDIPEGFEDKGYSVSNEQRGQALDLSVDSVGAQKRKIVGLRFNISQLEEMIRAD